MRALSCGMYGLVLSLVTLNGCALLDATKSGEASDQASASPLQGTGDRPDGSVPAPEVAIAGEHEPLSNADADVIRSVQAALNERGFPVGRPDGMIGAQTIRGLRLFKVARRMPVTDAITPRLLVELSVPRH